MGEVETKLCWSDQGTFLVDMVTEHFTKGEVENVSGSVVVPEGPSS